MGARDRAKGQDKRYKSCARGQRVCQKCNRHIADKRTSRRLRSEGWNVIRVWECRVTSPFTLERIRKAFCR
jgi:G:T-mismatch repair DNA endonuclease (very short patch repair protein)